MDSDYSLNIDKHSLKVLAGGEVISAVAEGIPSVTRYGYNKYTNSVQTTPDYTTYYYDIFNNYNYIRYIPRIDTVSAIDADQLAELAKEATYMLPEGKVGEGVVIKDYDYRYYGCQQFFKLVVNEFFEQKRANRKERTALEGGIECVIVDKFATVSEIEKARSKTLLRLGDDAELERVLPMTMELVFHDIVQENGYELAKIAMKNGMPVDFGRLRKAVQDKVRSQILGR